MKNKINIDLTEIELKILKMLTEGLYRTEIMKKLNISAYTIRKHIENILEKTNTKNIVFAVHVALKNGLL